MLINSPHISGSLKVTGNSVMTGSLTVTGQVIAQTLNVQQVTSSIIYSSGSNVFGNSLANTQQFTGSMSVTGSLSVNNTPAVLGSGTTNYITKFTTAGTVGNSGIFESGSNVGIGTTTLSEKVNIDGNILLRSAGGIKFNRLDNAIFTHLYDAGTFFALDNRNGNGFDFQSAGTSQMRITSGGDIEIKKSDSRIRGGDASGRVILSNSDTSAYLIINGSSNGNSIDLVTNQYITFNSGASYSERMRITSGGNVLIGTTTDNGFKLQVNGSISASDQLKRYIASINSGQTISFSLDDSGFGMRLFMISAFNNANANANIMALCMVNTRNLNFGGGNSILTIGTTQNSTGTSGEISSLGYSIGGSGTALTLNVTASLASGSGSIQIRVQEIKWVG
jgi:hypothetical protein